MSTFYVTTPIYYVNDVPHLGHAYTTIVADTLARYHRMRGDHTRFLTGTDEHGQKVEEAANKRGLTPQQLVDQVAPRFDETWKTLGIDRYRFIRTTSDKHKKVVAHLWKRIREHNPEDLYLASYQGWYCVGCEAFYTESQLIKEGDQWCCAIHKKPVNWLDKERSWFFKLSKYAEPLLAYIDKNPDFIRPEQYRNEIVSFLKGGLKDLSVSRTSFQWGIPVPEPDPEGLSHVIYVWMDALTNYLSDLCPADGSIGGKDVAEYWPHALHIIGKDILRFHTVYWPAFLMAAGLPLPKGIFAHGWWTVRGEKISKSMPATRIDPIKLADALSVGPLGRPIGIDAMRYFLLREVPLGLDGDFTFESLFGRFNAELANDLGNLVNRSLTLIGKSPVRPAYDGFIAESGAHAALAAVAKSAIAEATLEYDRLAPSRALEAIWKLVREANKYVGDTQPWALAKDDSKSDELAHVYHMLASVIAIVGGLVTPVLPTTGRALRQWVGVADDALDRWPTPEDLMTIVGEVAKDPKPLYPRLDDKAQKKIFDTMVPPDTTAPAPAPAAAEATNQITYEDFAKLDLRVGRVASAQPIKGKDKLLQLTVDLGEAAPRTIVAGIAQAFPADSLVGKSVIVVANLAPRKMAGLMSQGMILAAGDEQILGLSAVDRDVPPGTRVK
ncbi:MAG: methionine--tRNA ligase [Deltaproteobacteria bacterium]|nr:methionine--tRNA ligase [Deltaproteobacteria bacterium]